MKAYTLIYAQMLILIKTVALNEWDLLGQCLWKSTWCSGSSQVAPNNWIWPIVIKVSQDSVRTFKSYFFYLQFPELHGHHGHRFL